MGGFVTSVKTVSKVESVKYFFLSEGWVIGRVWELGGLWDELSWRRKPDLHKLDLSIVERDETLWLYRVEDAVLMVEVKPDAANESQVIGQVVLKRLISAEQVIDLLCTNQLAAASLERLAVE